MNSNLFEMTVCVNGRPIREYGHRGLTFVEGRRNQPYTLKFRNNSARRVLAVISVDGLSVVDGKPAENDSRGYIVPAYQQIEITGWRTSLEETNQFVFDTKKRANSTQQQGEDTNCGVIAVKVFDEKVTETELNKLLKIVTSEEHHHHWHHHHHPIVPIPHKPWEPYGPVWCGTSAPGSGILRSTSLGEPTYSASNNLCPPQDEPITANFVQVVGPVTPIQETPDFNLGTGWGKKQEDKVSETSFDRGIELACFSIYYSDAAGMKAAGIVVDKKPAVSKPVLPRGFSGFCKPPVVTSS